MGTLWIVFNIFLVILLWGMANGAFAEGKNIRGWINIILSAANAASVANMIFS